MLQASAVFAAAQTPASDFWTKVAIAVIGAGVGAALGFVSSFWSDSLKARRDPKKRISYEISVGASLASVPQELSDKVTVLFESTAVDGLLYQVTCFVQNTGNQLIKDQYLRFSFPDGSVVLDTFQQQEAPQEMRVSEAALEKPARTDRRWCIGHFEIGQDAQFGFLVASPSIEPPQIYGYNQEGGVNLVPMQTAVASDDASHVTPLVALLLFGWLLPSVSYFYEGLNDLVLVTSGIRLIILILAYPHLRPVARVVQRKLARDPVVPAPEVPVERSGDVILATRGSIVNLESPDPKPSRDGPPPQGGNGPTANTADSKRDNAATETAEAAPGTDEART